MIGYHNPSSALTLLVLLTSSFLHLSSPNPIENPQKVKPTEIAVSGDGERKDEERWLEKREAEDKEELDDDLFKDVDPKTLAAVLLEAMNRSHAERRLEGEEAMAEEGGEASKEETPREVGTTEDRERDGRQKIELLMGAQGREQQRLEAEEKKKAQEEEERMTERVTSRTSSQTLQVQPQTIQQEPQSQTGGPPTGQGTGVSANQEQGSEVEEQLNPEELQSLETVMKEFPRLNTATKREGGLEGSERAGRGDSSYNDIIPSHKGLGMSKKKLKWQEERQKTFNVPSFRGNFMDDFDFGNRAAQPQEAAGNPEEEEEEEEEEEDNEEVLSPEEEEAQAKAEQEEMRRQAAEAQRAKMEEEKLADIASDMLLRYMVKQSNGNKKYGLSLPNAAEDKRSDEEQEATEEDDIDPQTIDKLIEISSKLHLPADDVVDIISDVEKKKKKDVAPEMSRWQQQQQQQQPAPVPSGNNFPAFPALPPERGSPPTAKQPSPATYVLKNWFQEKSPTRLQDPWRSPAPSNPNKWPKPQKPVLVKQNPWLKAPKPLWSAYPPSPYMYRTYAQRKHYPDYYPIYLPPAPRPKYHFYAPQPALALNNFLQTPEYAFPPKRRYNTWLQPRLRTPTSGLQRDFGRYPRPPYPWRAQPRVVLKSPSPPRMSALPSQQKQFYYSAPVAGKDKDYPAAGKQSESSRQDSLERYIQQIIMNRPQRVD